MGPLVVPGRYTVTIAKRHDGELSELDEPQSFTVKPMPLSPEITTDRAALQAFQRKAAELHRAVSGAVRAASELGARIDHLKEALVRTPAATEEQNERLRALARQLSDIERALNGDTTISSHNEPTYEIASREFEQVTRRMRSLESSLSALEAEAETIGAPWTPGRSAGQSE